MELLIVRFKSGKQTLQCLHSHSRGVWILNIRDLTFSVTFSFLNRAFQRILNGAVCCECVRRERDTSCINLKVDREKKTHARCTINAFDSFYTVLCQFWILSCLLLEFSHVSNSFLRAIFFLRRSAFHSASYAVSRNSEVDGWYARIAIMIYCCSDCFVWWAVVTNWTNCHWKSDDLIQSQWLGVSTGVSAQN